MTLVLNMQIQPNGGAAYQKFMLGFLIWELTLVDPPFPFRQYALFLKSDLQ